MISIVVPVYNAEKYLDECLLSIHKQIYREWECIVVNDGSKDKSADICDEWSGRDARFRVIHQPNGGVSKARNAGLAVAKGEFVTFIDSDDWVDENYLETLNNGKYCDLIVAGIQYEYQDGRKEIRKPTEKFAFSLDEKGLDAFVRVNRDFLLYGPVSKLYKTSILKGYTITFPEGCSFGEDLQFNYSYLEYVEEICLVDEAHYHYRIAGSGTLSSKTRKNQFQQDYEQWKMLRSFYERHGLWSKPSKELLYERLWGIVYDGLFSSSMCNKHILSIPELKEMRHFLYVFDCSWWIKMGIVYRIYFIFDIYQLLTNRR